VYCEKLQKIVGSDRASSHDQKKKKNISKRREMRMKVVNSINEDRRFLRKAVFWKLKLFVSDIVMLTPPVAIRL